MKKTKKSNKYHIYMIIVLLPFLSCRDEKIKNINDLFLVNENLLSKQQQNEVESAKEFLLAQREGMSRSGSGMPENFLKAEEIEKLTFTTIPFYKLDTSFLSSDMDHEHLQRYIKPETVTPMYIGQVNGKISIMMNLKDIGNGVLIPDFSVEGTDYFSKVFSWLLPLTKESSKKEFYILEALKMQYIVYYTQDDKPMFCNFPGNIRMDELTFFKHIIGRYNTINAYREEFKDCIKVEE